MEGGEGEASSRRAGLGGGNKGATGKERIVRCDDAYLPVRRHSGQAAKAGAAAAAAAARQGRSQGASTGWQARIQEYPMMHVLGTHWTLSGQY